MDNFIGAYSPVARRSPLAANRAFMVGSEKGNRAIMVGADNAEWLAQFFAVLRVRPTPRSRTRAHSVGALHVRPPDGAARVKRLMLRNSASAAEGFRAIALLLGVDESTARRAYKTVPALRRVIHKRGGRYSGDPKAIVVALLGHESDLRHKAALKRKRGANGKFACGTGGAK